MKPTALQNWAVSLALLMSAVLAGSTLAQAQNTYLYIAHAASGRAISATTNPALPVDVSVNGICISNGMSFGEIRGPFSGPAGTYTFQVSTANSAAPCTGTSVFSASVPLSPDTAYFGVISVGSSKTVTGMIFTVDLSPIPPGQSRVEVVNATEENLNATIKDVAGTTSILPVPASTLQEGAVAVGIYQSEITNSTNNVVTGPFISQFSQQSLYLYVLAGSGANQSGQIIGPKVIGGVF